MTKFLLAYHGGNAPSSKEEGDRVMAAWGQWMGSLGKAMVEPGNPTAAAKTIGADGQVSNGGGSNPVTGYTVLEAESLDAAVALCKSCPQLSSGGSIEVAEIMAIM
jgi:hypothetical protein